MKKLQIDTHWILRLNAISKRASKATTRRMDNKEFSKWGDKVSKIGCSQKSN
jgi:hypothetical protein